MKKPEMEIVKFHNEDVIATSNWSGRYKVWSWPIYTSTDESGCVNFVRDDSRGGMAYFNSPLFKTYGSSGQHTEVTNQNYKSNNYINGQLTPGAESNSQYEGQWMHFDYNSLVGGWNLNSVDHQNRVYNVWKTCTGDENCTGNCHAN